MTSFTENALVLRAWNHGEKNRIVALLTEHHGVIHAFANGARSIKSKNFAATSQFVFGSYVLVPSKDSYTVKESNAVNNYGDIQGDIESLALAQYFCEVCMELAPEGTGSDDYLRLLRGALYYLSSGERDRKLLKAAFELRILTVSGFMPDLLMCSGCGAYEKEKMYFYPATGHIRCCDCVGDGTGAAVLNQGALTAMRHCVLADTHKLYAFSISESALDMLSRAAERYLTACLDRSFKTLEFYKGLLRK